MELIEFAYLAVFVHMSMTRRDHKVVDFTRSRVKNNSKLTNLMKMYRIEGYNGNKGRIHKELRYFLRYLLEIDQIG